MFLRPISILESRPPTCSYITSLRKPEMIEVNSGMHYCTEYKNVVSLVNVNVMMHTNTKSGFMKKRLSRISILR